MPAWPLRPVYIATLMGFGFAIPGPSLAAVTSTPDTRPSAADVVALSTPGDLTLSADGRWAAFTLSVAKRDTAAVPSAESTEGGWKRTRQVVLLDLGTRAIRTLTSGDDRAGAPRFSPDGHTLAFTRKAAVWLLPLDGGEARKLDTGKLVPEAFRFSPDSRGMAFTSPSERSTEEIAKEWQAGGAFDWAGQWHRSRLWVLPLTGGLARAVSPDSLHIADFEWSPDGLHFAVLSSRDGDPYQVFNDPRPRVLSVVDGHIEASLVRSSDSYGNAYDHLTWTPDSRSILLTGLNGGLSNVNALLRWDVASGTVRDLTPDRDLTLDGLTLANAGRDAIVLQRARTEARFLRFPVAGGAPQDVGFRGRVSSGALLSDAAGRKLVFLSSTPREPQDVTVFDLGTRRSEVVTQLNPQAARWTLGGTQVVRWKNSEGTELEGLLTRPPGATAATALMVMPHGGPDDVSQQSFSSQVQLFASRGYAVFRPNYRGGTGYGFAFYAANRNRFGTIEQMDIESGVDALVERGLADPQRLYFGGWSWGGYITAWTIGHVQRYRAAVVGAGVNDVFSSYSSSDINHGVAAQWEYEGDPWRQTEHFDRANPVRYAKDMKTPTLILHGQGDDRVHFMNGITLYRALADVGCEVKFWAYPREPHGFQEPAHLVHRLETWLRWYDEHGGPAAGRP